MSDVYADLDKCMPLPIYKPASEEVTENLGRDILHKYIGCLFRLHKPSSFSWGTPIEESMNNGYRDGLAKVATRGRSANYQCNDDSQAVGTPIVKRAVRNLARSILEIIKLSQHTPNAIKLQDVANNICSSGAQAREHKICMGGAACEVEGTQ